MSASYFWLWPDHIAGKRETRRLREEHNKLARAQSARSRRSKQQTRTK